VEIFDKDFLDLHDSKREEKLLSSSDFVTAASMVQQFANLNGSNQRSRMNLGWCIDGPLRLPQRVDRFARLPWVIYTSHSSYSHYCTY
jgi:hypothetical protein